MASTRPPLIARRRGHNLYPVLHPKCQCDNSGMRPFNVEKKGRLRNFHPSTSCKLQTFVCVVEAGARAPWVRTSPGSHLMSPRLLIFMAINRFCWVSAVSASNEGQEAGKDGARESVQAGGKIVRERETERERERERERGPQTENSWQLIGGKGDPVYCTDRTGMCSQMMRTGSMATLPLSVLAKTHHHQLPAASLFPE